MRRLFLLSYPLICEFGEGDWILMEELISAHLDRLFPDADIFDAHLFRVTRDADLDTVEDEADDLLEAIEAGLRQRRFGSVVRLEVGAEMPRTLRDKLLAGLEITEGEVQVVAGVIDLSVALQVAGLPRPDLRAPRWQPIVPARIAATTTVDAPNGDLFAVISDGDLLVHHPYDSFEASVDRLFAQAADDPDVLSIRSTLYRTGATSSIPTHLIRAVHAGKEVVVLVELKARFDEAANIEWARRLEEAGAHVVYGVTGLKTHCKACLVVRQEKAGLRRYAHLGTGNYNPKTARLYTDVGFLTADPDITADDFRPLPPWQQFRPSPPPGMLDRTPADQLSIWHKRLGRFFEIGTLYTMLAGMLNVLAIYDAFAGPLGAGSAGAPAESGGKRS